MPTLVAALTLSALLKMAHVDLPRWHLAFWFGLLVALALFGSMPRTQAVLHALQHAQHGRLRRRQRGRAVLAPRLGAHQVGELFQATRGLPALEGGIDHGQ